MNVAITGVGGGVGQAVIRALRRSRLDLHLIGLDANPWAAGLYQCEESAIIPSASQEEAYVAALLQVAAERQVDALIPGTDTEVPVIARHQRPLRAAGCVPIVSAPRLVAAIQDKLACGAWFAAAGIPYARTVTGQQFVEGCGLKFPVIVKPRHGSGSVGARVLTDPAEAERDRIGADDVVQEYLVPRSWSLTKALPEHLMKGARLRQEDEVSMQGLVAPDGAVVGIFASINDLRDGVPMRIRPTRDPDILRFTRRTLQALAHAGHVGPCNLQGRITDDGLVLYEANARFTGITAVRAAMGWNGCEAALRLFVLGEPSAAVARGLDYDEELVCLRYITEEVVSRAIVDESGGGVLQPAA
jgi:carbamoyl-phosphate synthase large subunit